MKTLAEKLVILYILLSYNTENQSVNDCRLDKSYCNYWCSLFYYKVLPFALCFFGISANWLVDTPVIYLDGTITLSLEVLQQSIKWKAPKMEATHAVPQCRILPEVVKQPVCLCDVMHLQNLCRFELWQLKAVSK